MKPLARRECLPCRGQTPSMGPDEIASLAAEVKGWAVVDGHHLNRRIETRDFAESLALANRIGAVAEKAGHHPDLVVAWGRVVIDIFTHKIDGLTASDFILAAKIDAALKPRKRKRPR